MVSRCDKDEHGVPRQFVACDGRAVKLAPFVAEREATHFSRKLNRQEVASILRGERFGHDAHKPVFSASEQSRAGEHRRDRIQRLLRSDAVIIMSSIFASVLGAVCTYSWAAHQDGPETHRATSPESRVTLLTSEIQASVRKDDFLTASLESVGIVKPRYTGRINLSLGACVLEGVTIDTQPLDMLGSISAVPDLPSHVTDITAYHYGTADRAYTFVNQAQLQQQVGSDVCSVLLLDAPLPTRANSIPSNVE